MKRFKLRFCLFLLSLPLPRELPGMGRQGFLKPDSDSKELSDSPRIFICSHVYVHAYTHTHTHTHTHHITPQSPIGLFFRTLLCSFVGSQISISRIPNFLNSQGWLGLPLQPAPRWDSTHVPGTRPGCVRCWRSNPDF